MCGKRERDRKVQVGRAGCARKTKREKKKDKEAALPASEIERSSQAEKTEKTEAGRNKQTMTHPTSSLTGTTTRFPRATWRAGAPIFFKHHARPASPKSQQGARHIPRKTRAETSVFPVLFPLFSFFPFPFPSASTPQNPQRGTGGPEI